MITNLEYFNYLQKEAANGGFLLICEKKDIPENYDSYECKLQFYINMLFLAGIEPKFWVTDIGDDVLNLNLEDVDFRLSKLSENTDDVFFDRSLTPSNC